MCACGVSRRNAHRKAFDVLVFGVLRFTIPLSDRYRATVLAHDEDWSGLFVFRRPAVFADPGFPLRGNIGRLGSGFQGSRALRGEIIELAKDGQCDSCEKPKAERTF